MVFTFDRLRAGLVNVFVDGRHLAQQRVPLVASPKVAQEIWVNSRDFGNLDTGFRGWISRLKMCAQPLSLEDAVVECEFLRPFNLTILSATRCHLHPQLTDQML